MRVLRGKRSNSGVSNILKLSLKKLINKLLAQNLNDTCDIIHAIIRFFFFFPMMECYYKDICMFLKKKRKKDMHELVELNHARIKILCIAH